MTLGEFIATRRKYLRLTQEELAEQIHVSKSAVAKWETNGGIPDRDNLQRLAIVIGVSVEDLYGIIRSDRMGNVDINTYITADVIGVLESYGYQVIAPKGNS